MRGRSHEIRQRVVGIARWAQLEHVPFSYAGSTPLRGTSIGEKPRGLKHAARNTETGNALVGRKEASARPVGSDAQPQLSQATGAAALIGRACTVAVDTRVDSAAFEVNPDPRAPTQTSPPPGTLSRVLEPFDVKMIRRRLFHQCFYRLL